MKTTNKMVTVMECKYCDCSTSHRPYGMDDVATCVSCGAEWDPIAVQYTHEDVYGTTHEYGMDDVCVECYVASDVDATGVCMACATGVRL